MLTGGLIGCATTDQGPAPIAAEPVAEDPIAGLIEAAPAARRGPPASSFVGQPIASLEALVGSPALVRQEGANEFRRYDLGSCRAYAIVIPAGGNVASLTTGGLTVGSARPDFQDCTAGRSPAE